MNQSGPPVRPPGPPLLVSLQHLPRQQLHRAQQARRQGDVHLDLGGTALRDLPQPVLRPVQRGPGHSLHEPKKHRALGCLLPALRRGAAPLERRLHGAQDLLRLIALIVVWLVAVHHGRQRMVCGGKAASSVDGEGADDEERRKTKKQKELVAVCRACR